MIGDKVHNLEEMKSFPDLTLFAWGDPEEPYIGYFYQYLDSRLFSHNHDTYWADENIVQFPATIIAHSAVFRKMENVQEDQSL